MTTDISGNAYIGGVTNSTSGIATCKAHQSTMNGISDGFLAKFGKRHHHNREHDYVKGQRVAPVAGVSNGGEFSVYPNPNTGSFILEIPAITGDAVVTITDIGGRTVEKRNVVANNGAQKIQFDLSGKSKGLHFVEVISGDNRYFTKVLLQ